MSIPVEEIVQFAVDAATYEADEATAWKKQHEYERKVFHETTSDEEQEQAYEKRRLRQEKKPRARRTPKVHTLEVQNLIDQFNEADRDGETYAMAVAYKEIQRTGLKPATVLKMRARLTHGCDTLKQRVREMMKLVQMLNK